MLVVAGRHPFCSTVALLTVMSTYLFVTSSIGNFQVLSDTTVSTSFLNVQPGSSLRIHSGSMCLSTDFWLFFQNQSLGLFHLKLIPKG